MSDDAVDYGGKVISSESDVLSVMSGHTSNEGCHSIAQLIMSDLQISMGDNILQMIVCLRDGKEPEAAEQP